MFVRVASRAGYRAVNSIRQYATNQHKSSNLPLYLGGVGIIGLGTYVYMEYGSKVAAQKKSPLDPDNFVDFKLRKIEPYNHNTSKFIFELPDRQASLLPIASCLVVKSSDSEAMKDEKGNPIIRPYTPISPSDLQGDLVLLIKRYESGNMSKHIHTLSPGDKLSIKGPILKWPYKINEFDHVALIGGGTGITPLYQVVNHALEDKTNTTKFTLLFSNVTEKDILLREQLDTLKKRHPNNFEVVYLIDNPEKNWTGPIGFISAEVIKKYIAPPSLGEKVKVFVCGPPGQVAAVAGKKAGMKQGELGGILKDLGYTEDQVYKF
jgi:cytochrome-b5 reductase